MTVDQELENTIIYKCSECGLSNSILKDNHSSTTAVDRA
ncbi:hypothetical protein NTE_00174 [Candidatus Nitrososphaera evergladensis SR1]|uniref:Uncharacterized protein n=1 Tax=Candidatus Nitrososphaera evergladensis SR1 TaxID=1459636 RepID=A0A075MLF0_9ARCH|nr:hypothetical protein NTE_00174 [Candidatus Nitrososphaera evergladensis SR1]